MGQPALPGSVGAVTSTFSIGGMKRSRSAGRLTDSWDLLRPFLPPRSKLRVVVIGVLSFLGGLAESGVLILLTLTADSLLRGLGQLEIGGLSLGRTQAVLLALVLLIGRVVTILSAWQVSVRLSSAVTENAQLATIVSYMGASYSARAARPPGDLSTIVVNHGRFTGELAAMFSAIAVSVCGLLAFGGASLWVNPLATGAIAAIGLLVLAMMQPLRRRSQKAARSFAESARVLGRDVTEIEALNREIELFRVQDKATGRVSDQVTEGVRYLQSIRFLSSATPPLFQAAMLGAAVLSLLIIMGGVEGAQLAAVGSVVLLLIRSMSSAQQYVTAKQRVIELAPFAEGVNELILSLTSQSNSFGQECPRRLTPLVLDSIDFTYDGTTRTLRDIDLEFRKGQIVGVAGPSGAGKSTLVEVLLRLRPPSGGRITGGTTDWNDIDPQYFASQVAFVPQQAVLIAGTVAENVDLFRGLPEERIRDALKEAHLESEIEALPDGIHTRLGPDDRALSGGQCQRLTIARALAGEPEILILDEPTSALDAVSEASIRQTLEELPTGRLVIVIAHRFSTLRSCSRIIVLGNGQVEVDATPDEVTQRSDFFRAMVNEGA